jgi:hypothetical protein
MPRDSIGQYSTTPGDNTDIGGINIAEGMLPSDVNNAMRELLSQLKEFQTGAGGDTISPPVLIATTATVGTLKATSTATFDSGVVVSGESTLSGGSLLKRVKETTTVSATAAANTINYDFITQSVLYYTSNATGNWALNVRGDSSTTLNSVMATGQSATVAFLATQGSTAYYQTALQVDGSNVTPKWQGGDAPTAGNASSVDAYVFTIVKTANATFTVLGSQTQFA